MNEDDYFSNTGFGEAVGQLGTMTTRLPAWYFSSSHAYTLLCPHFGTASLKQFGIEQDEQALEAAGALFRYLQETAKTSLAHVDTLRKVDRTRALLIDEATRKNLELLHNLQDGSKERTLFSALDMTCTAGGSRMLKS